MYIDMADHDTRRILICLDCAFLDLYGVLAPVKFDYSKDRTAYMDPHSGVNLGCRRDSSRSCNLQGRSVYQPHLSWLSRSRSHSRHHALVDLFLCAEGAAVQKAFYFTGASLSGSFSGLLATALRKMDGISGQHGWQWVFYIEGIFTVAVAIVCYFIIPNGPRGCFMLSPLERELIMERQHAPTYRYQDLPHLALKLKEVKFEPTSENEGPLLPPQCLNEVMRSFIDELVYITSNRY